VLARDEHGRSHERVVPDANSAGVLIASWSADDVVGAPAPVPPAAPVAVAPVAPPPVAPAPPPQVAAAPITRPPEIAGPSERVALAGPPGAEAVDRPSLVDSLGSPRHWLTVAYLTKVRTTRLDSDPNRGQGVALGLDPWNYGPLSFGFDSAIDYRSGVDYQLRHVADASVAFHASVMLGTARVHLVPSVSAGWVYTYALQSDATYQTLSSIAEASLTAAIRLDRHAEATAGAISTYYGQRTPAPLIYRDWDLAVLGGVRWGW
jgi:hypothetical protein